MTAVTEALVMEIEAAFNSRDVERILSYFAEDGVFFTARGPTKTGIELKGKAAIGVFLRDRFSYIPDMYWNPQYRFVAGDRGVSYWTVTGTNQRTGATLDLHGCDIFHFRDGKIVLKDTFWKTIEP
ncbi:ketosteroid isomerase-like protein [Stella humosa]|uniref:Ketosteroid isomerase-like protein n=1 Tax=Stella humosa TaxID=94 RepID=A0A3N1ME42_9PROT|nr:nuclear transport factor 2 family protein [Stella humosa]ROQ01828.1 ketosteroid isomerase-like protein [Stella humosa]BBK32215.1 ketosteroid isomerase [Stella humosa]